MTITATNGASETADVEKLMAGADMGLVDQAIH